MRDDDDFVASTDEIGAEHVNVIFYPSHVGVEKIGYHSAQNQTHVELGDMKLVRNRKGLIFHCMIRMARTSTMVFDT